jgi:predicted acyl esterase
MYDAVAEAFRSGARSTGRFDRERACNSDHVYRFAGEGKTPAGARRDTPLYVTMRDGVQIAVDVWLPQDYQAGQRLPVLRSGSPVVALEVASTATDGAFLAYLEDVAPDGHVTYLDEGELRAVSRKQMDARERPYNSLGPSSSNSRADAQPLVPGSLRN